MLYDRFWVSWPWLPTRKRNEVCVSRSARLPPSMLRRPKRTCCELAADTPVDAIWAAEQPSVVASCADRYGLLQLTTQSPSGFPVTGFTPVPDPMNEPLGAICASVSSFMNMNSE